ncbi:Protein-disulfide isomerase [Slackia heliotrinireducens]|uniref:Predicted dithiol-disulfide isomerase involved in polyketide biosynthesis n=1 Tax=Slackia heliotrinireducens (strain ATCC 29202 / DSM 20476 / NCTC 11029 / RHS 1) TaxID=471855 RepID=C7N153_SLAHD|nr:DsbA family oxidoreductase [Slackia heliotrinireducens]ACV23275.1 predicted dithiol-disulfide isomerase involved in polyketide biosynthesis [Slackia heliotrinireducens DSM 20476]VEH02437.1 Protein-disulfide isomerase [Slackia heliotrinireducens]
MNITYWSDFACPYCYIGETRLKKAIDSIGMTGQIDVEMKAFELNPDASYEVTGPTLDRFAAKYGLTKDQAAERIEGISQMGREEGLDFNYATTLNTNMLDAHRLTKLAHSLGNTRFEELCYRAYFTDNLVMADHDVLRGLAAEAGLPAQDVERVLSSDEFADAVRADEHTAYAMGVHAVPFFVIDGTYAVSGCYPTDDLADVIKQALAKSQEQETAQGAACGPDGCAL